MSGVRAAVVGGSLAGLTAALLLRDLNFEVDVFERSPVALEGLGAGIIVHEPTVRYFVERSSISLDDISLTSGRLQYLRPDGSIEFEQESDYRFTAWSSLFRGLESLFDESRYHRSHTLVGFDQDSDGVDLRFAEGAERRFDLVVCADGVGSVARRRLFGVEAHYSGYVGWRGICSSDEVSSETWEILDDTFTYALVGNEHVVAYPIPIVDRDVHVSGYKINYTWYRNVDPGPDYDELMTDRLGLRRPTSVPPGLAQERQVAQMRADAVRLLAPPVAELVSQARDPFITAIVDADCPSLCRGRICLIGDAAITARPHAAAGSAKAAADAWSLAEALDGVGADGIPDAVRAWEGPALQRGRALLERTRDMGRRLQGGADEWKPADPGNRFGLVAPSSPA